jgi:tetratricopeptide (TPR) repeat protein
MHFKNISMLLSLVSFLAACSSIQVSGEFASGRHALLTGNNQEALGYFQSAAQKDPNYKYGIDLPQGILSYVGRSEYAIGRLPEARQTLEKALAANQDENITRLYLGLTLARIGERQRGAKEIESSMQGLYNFLEQINQRSRFSYGQYWDPSREIRREIQGTLVIAQKEQVDWPSVIARGEQVGKRMEEEIDKAAREERFFLLRDGGADPTH